MIDKEEFIRFIVDNLSSIIKDELLDKLNNQVSPAHIPEGFNVTYMEYKNGTIRQSNINKNTG